MLLHLDDVADDGVFKNLEVVCFIKFVEQDLNLVHAFFVLALQPFEIVASYLDLGIFEFTKI